jgi:dolichol-phosphate mannosyltransferase
MRKLISIVVPCYNESEILKDFIEELNKEIEKIDEDFEIIFVDNGSDDNSVEILCKQSVIFKRYQILEFSNYFGKESAMLAGLDHANNCDAVILMDPDLEDPPSLLKELIYKWKKEGFDVVYGIRSKEESPFYKKILKNIFFKILNSFLTSNNSIPKNTGDFRLIDKKIRDHIISFRERTRFARGIISFIGFKQIGIFYNRVFRKKGKSKSSINFLIQYSMDSLFSVSSIPVTILTRVGVFFLFVAFLISIFLLIQKFLGQSIPGFTFLILIIFFVFSFNIFALGILGEYVSRIYNEVKQRPNYIIKKKTTNKDI